MTVDQITVADGVDLALTRLAGAQRPTFLLVHGLASNQGLWTGVANELARSEFPVTTVDLRGHGLSSKPDDGYDIPTVASDLAHVIEMIDQGPVVVAGQSWGGNIVLELARSRSDLVVGAVAVDGGWIDLGAIFPTFEECWAALAPPALAGLRADEVEAMFANLHPDWPEAGIAGALANFERHLDGTVSPWFSRSHHESALRGLWSDDPTARSPHLDVPVLLIPARNPGAGWAGDKDAAVEEMGSTVARGQIEWIAGDHDIHAQHPELVTTTMLRWLQSEVAP